MNLKFVLVLIIALILSILPTDQTKATHLMGADISYLCLNPDSNIYLITLNLYRDCAGVGAPISPSVSFESISCGYSFNQALVLDPPGNITPGGTPNEVSQLCDSLISLSSCNGGSLPGVELFTYTTIVTLPDTCEDWVMSWSSCCRNNLITNLAEPGGDGMYVEATLDNTDTCNSSPTFTNLPVTYICAGQPFNYNHGAIDADGDSLVYTLVPALENATGQVAYAPGFTPTGPISTTNGIFALDTLTGQLTFTPDSQQIAVVTFLVEEYADLDGDGVHETLVGSTMRDMQIIILDLPGCSNPGPDFQGIDTATLAGGVIISSGTVEVCPGDSLIFELSGTGIGSNTADSCIKITSNVAIAIPGATFDTLGFACDSARGYFSWLPTAFDIGTHNLNVFLNINSCPFRNVQTFNITIEVLDGTFAGPDLVYCPKGGPRQINVAGGSEWHWTPSGPGSGIIWANGDSSKIRVAPSVTTDYMVMSDLSSTCKNRDTVNVKVVPDFIEGVTATKDTICLYDSTFFQVTIAPPDLIWSPFSYDWTPDKSLSMDSVPNPGASPFVTTNYIVAVTSDTGCTIRDSVKVVVSGVSPPFVIFDGYPTVCLGDSNRIEVVTCNTIFSEDFDTLSPANWSNVTGNVDFVPCGAVIGNGLFFNDAALRTAETVDLNVIGGGKVEFWIKYGDGFPCDAPEPGDEVRLQYSLNGGGNWTTIQTLINFGGQLDTFKFFSTDIPLFAQSPTTRFRWVQNVFAFGSDNWAIDEIIIRRGCCDTTCNYDYQWSPTVGVTDPTSMDPLFHPIVTTTYTVTVTVPGTDCFIVDSLEIVVAPDFTYTDFVSEDTICLNDSVQLLVTPDLSGAPYTFDWIPAGVVTDPALSDPKGFPFQTTNYQYTVISQLGCRKIDSIPVVVSGVSPAFLLFIGNPTVCLGDSNLISVETCLNFFEDDFDPDVDLPLWSVNNGLATNDCDFVSPPNALTFANGTATAGREARTNSLNVTAGGLIEFWLKIANSFAPGCETADQTEDVVLEYSVNGGGSWVIINTYPFNQYPNFTFFSVPVPFAAQTGSTIFRWRQLNWSCTTCDNWALDDVSIQLGCCDAACGPYTYQWSPTTGLSDPNVQNPIFFPTVTTTYTVTVTVPGTDCQQIDSITINVVPDYDYTFTVTDDTICLFDSVAFLITPDDPAQAPYSYQWIQGGQLTSDSIPDPGAIPPSTFNYAVTITSAAGCTHVDSIPVVVGGVAPQFVQFTGNNVVCAGDSNRITVLGCEGSIEDDFDPGLNIALWDPVTTGIPDGTCGSVSGSNSLYFNDAQDRNATTLPLDVTIGGNITFEMKFGTGNFGSGCETADPFDGVELQYSVSGLAGPWVTINNWNPPIFPTFTTIVEPIPAAAQTGATIFRWVQINFAGLNFDNWVIDDVVIDVPCGPFDYQWSPTTGISDPTSDAPLFFPMTTTTYYVTVSAQNPECRKIDSITIFVVPGFEYSVEVEDDTICENQSTHINITPDTIHGPYTYSWSPLASIENYDTGASAHVRPKESTYYTYIITSEEGCIQIDSSLVHVDGRGPFVRLSLDNNFVCPGEPVEISAEVSVLTCGITSTPGMPCPANSQFVVGQIGTGVQSSVAETPFKGFWTESRVQMLYRSQELVTAGLSAGTITDLAWRIDAKLSSQPYQGYTIKIGCTNLNNLNSYVNGLQTVYTNASYGSFVGWNTFTLDNPYDWDGQTNIIVEVCFDNGTSNWTQSDPVFGQFTNYNSVVWDQGDFEVGCALPNPITSTFRPNILFVACTYDAAGVTLQWEPSDGLFNTVTGVPCDTCNPVSAVVYSDQTYTLTAFDGTCPGDSSITIRIDSSFYIHAQTDTAICYSDSVPLEVLIIGTPPSSVFACGVDSNACAGNTNIQVLQLGTGTGNTASNTNHFSIYNSTFSDSKTQMIFTASELTAAGMLPGTITDLTFFISNKLAMWPPYEEFTISIGCTNLSDMNAGFSSQSLTDVYGPLPTATVAGPNTYTLNPGFDWDGFSNIMVQICFHNTATLFVDEDIFYTNTSFNSVAWAGQDATFGCQLTTAIQIHDRRPNIVFVQCIAADAAISYEWSPDSTVNNAFIDSIIATPTEATNYVIKASFANGCELYDSVFVDIGGFTYTKFPPNPDTICPGDTADLMVLGGDFIRWTNSDSTLTDTSSFSPGAFPLGTRWYAFVLSDSAGCQITDSILVHVFIPPPIDIGNDTVICSGQCVVLDAGPGWVGYDWNPDGQTTQTITVCNSGTYNVVLQDPNCSYPSPPVNVIIPTPPNLDPTAAFCFGESVTLTAPPGYVSYLWAITGDTTQTTIATMTGVYNVTVEDIFGCMLVSTDQVVTEVDIPNADLGIDRDYCAGSSITVGPVATAGADYLWQPTNETTREISVSSPGTYIVIVSVGSCMNSDTIVISENPSPIINLGADLDTCCGSVVNLIPTTTIPTVNYAWNDLSTGNSLTVSSTGIYSVTATDNNLCIGTDSILVEIQCIIDQVTAVESIINEGEVSTLTVTTLYNGNFTYDWDPGTLLFDSTLESSATLPLLSTLTFLVEVTDMDNQCVEFDTVLVSVIPTGFGVNPNAFTPNGDDLNDLFIPLVDGAYSINEFRIYNRWGAKLYDYDEDQNKAGWDGTANGSEQPVGSYVYYISYNKPNPDKPSDFIQEVKQGSVSLVR